MTETTEPTREQIEKRIAQLEGLLRGPEPAVGWEMDLAVYRMALRTLDAETIACSCKPKRYRPRWVQFDTPTREQIEVWASDIEHADWREDATIGQQEHVLRMALRTLDAEEELDRARKLHASFPGSPLASEVIDGQARRLEETYRQLAAMTKRAEEAEAKLESSRQVEACSKAFHDLVVKERDFERVRAARLEEERDVARVKIAAMTERAEKAERLAAALRVVAEHEVADAIVKSRERATRIGWIDHATGDYEERAADIPMDDLAVGSAVGAFLRMVGMWTLEQRAEKAERERHVAVSVMREMRVAWDAASAQRDDLRTRLAEVERERDEALSANDRITAMVGEVNELFVGYDDPVAAVRALIDDYRAATTARERLREALADARAKLASATQDAPAPTKDERLYALAENPTTHTRCEAIFQRKRADWWRDQAKRLGWTPDYPELREDPPSDARLDCESSSLLLLSTWARKVMMRPKNRAKGAPSESIRTLLWMARDELFEAYSAIEEDAPTDDILAELGDAAAIIGFAMREIEKRRKA